MYSRPLFRVINARSYNPSEVDPVAVMTRDGEEPESDLLFPPFSSLDFDFRRALAECS